MFESSWPHMIAIVANGDIHSYDVIAPRLKQFSYVIAVDGGLTHCHNMQCTPNLIVGDFDSVSQSLLDQYPHVPKQKYPCHKDHSDLELALQFALQQTPKQKICLFAALGLRIDHTLANLFLLCRHPDQVYIETEQEKIFAVSGKTQIDCQLGQTISLMPLSSTKGITTKGLRWELKEATLDKNFFSLSNICEVSPISIEIKNGDLICCLNNCKNS